MILEIICIALTIGFFWSTFVVLIGLFVHAPKRPEASPRTRFAVLVCARNEERVIAAPVRSVVQSKYPAALRDVIVLADNCTDHTAAVAREEGAIVWEKTVPSRGKGDVLAWGIERVLAEGGYDAVAVFDADNTMAPDWFDKVNAAFLAGEKAVTGRRFASNAKSSTISGWYAVYWSIMNELSNKPRTNLGLSAKLTGTGFAFLLSALPPEGWRTFTMVEDVEFTLQHNLRGGRIVYLPEAEYTDEQPERIYPMWRQLRRWATGGWQVLWRYTFEWLRTIVRRPSMRLFDSFFALLTGILVAFVQFFNILTLVWKLFTGAPVGSALWFFVDVFAFVVVMGLVTAVAAVALSPRKAVPMIRSIIGFPVFSLILSGAVLYTLVFPVKKWKPIAHNGIQKEKK